MRVADVMTSPVIGIEPSASIGDAARIMLDSHFSGLPVVNAEKRLVGIVAESDFLRRAELGTTRKRPRWLEFLVRPGKEAEEYVHAYGRKVEEVMTPEPLTIAPTASLDDLVELMTRRKIKRVPVVEQGRLVGIVARSDLMRAMLRMLPTDVVAAENDQQIAKAITDELAKQPWSSAIRVKVDHGAVELGGAIFADHAREAARVVAENVAGVKSVVDQLVWIEPISGMYILPEEPRHPQV